MFARHDLPNGVSLRPTQPSDKDFERMLHAARRQDLWFADAPADQIHDLIEMQQRAQIEGYGMTRPDARYYLIERTGVACGRLVIDFDAHGLRIVDLALVPQAQGKGIANTVLSAMQTVATSLPTSVTLCAFVQNAPALALYRKLGFQPAPPARQHNPAFLEMVWQPEALRPRADAHAPARS